MKKLFKNALQDKGGFTLVELVVVIVIVLILSAVLVPNVTKYIKNARIAVEKTNAQSIFTQFQADFEFAKLVGNDIYWKNSNYDHCIDQIGGVDVYLCHADARAVSSEYKSVWQDEKNVELKSGIKNTRKLPIAVYMINGKGEISSFSYSWKENSQYGWTPEDGWKEWNAQNY